MRIALINSGIGLLATAAELHRLRPDADLVLAMDPDGMPWGPRSPGDIAQRSLACARATAAFGPDVLVFACNTGTVHAVPAIKPAAAFSDSVAIWATVATTASTYQRRLIDDFAGSARVTPVPCPGLADAVDAGDEAAARAAVAGAAARTPADCGAVVLGCTEYELAADLIGAALPGVTLFRSAAAVAAQALRRVAAGGTDTRPDAAPSRTGTVRVLLSGRQAGPPEAALRYPEGRLLADLVVDDRPVDDRPVDDVRADDVRADDVRADDRAAEPRAAEPRAEREAEGSVPPSSVLA